MTRLGWILLASVLLGGSAAWAGGLFVEDFEDDQNEGGWTFGAPGETIEDSGGNPGAYLKTGVLDTFAPRLRTTLPGTFTGDYRAKGVTTIGVDLNTFSAQTTGGRPLAPMLIHDNGTPGDFSDDTAAYTLGPNIPSVAEGWVSYDFTVPSQERTLPDGWLLLNLGDIGAPPIHTWDEVIQNVSRLQYHYGDPTFVFIFQQWVLGADNIRIDGGEPPEVPATSAIAFAILTAILLALGSLALVRRRASA